MSKRNRRNEDRRSHRYPLEASASLVCGSDFFETVTLNMSTEGVLFNDPLPTTWLDKEITLKLSYENSEGTVLSASGLCQIVKGTNNRVIFLGMNNPLTKLVNKIVDA